MKSLIQIKRDAQNVEFDKRSSSDFLSYFEFVNFFKNKDLITKNDFVIGCNFAYGWMPTILNFKNESEEEIDICVDLVNKAKESKALLTKDELLILKKVVNNSIVGVSKLLHFISPEVYPIWDSRVASYLEVKDINNVQNFCNYLDYCHSFSKDELNEVRKILCQHDNSFENATGLRALEFVFFSKGLDTKKKIKKE